MFVYTSRPQAGFVAIISVMIVGALAISTSITLLLVATRATQTLLITSRAMQAQAMLDGCGEAALERVRLITAFTGTTGLIFPGGTASYTVINTGGETRTIRCTATFDTVVRKAKILVSQINPQITVTAWRGVADF